MRRAACALAVAATFWTACGGGYHGPSVGDVEKRTYYAAHVEEGATTVFISCGTGCSFPIFVPYSNNIPDAWYMTITSCDRPDDPKSCQRGSFEVTHKMFDSVTIGDRVEYAAVKK